MKNWFDQQVHVSLDFFWLVGWLVVLKIYVALAVFQAYRDLEAGDNQSLKFKWRGRESNPGPLAPQSKSLTTRPLPLPTFFGNIGCYAISQNAFNLQNLYCIYREDEKGKHKYLFLVMIIVTVPYICTAITCTMIIQNEKGSCTS